MNHVSKNEKKNDKKKKRKVKRKRNEEMDNVRESSEKMNFRERSSSFSLRFTEIGL